MWPDLLQIFESSILYYIINISYASASGNEEVSFAQLVG
jgi:hypothetical protein